VKAQPLIVKRGSVVVRVYRTPKRGYEGWTVVSHDVTGKRLAQFRATLPEAKALAEKAAVEIQNGERIVSSLKPADAAAYARAIQLLQPTGKAIEVVAAEYVEATNGLAVPLSEVTRYYRTHHPVGESRTVKTLVEEFVNSKRQDGASRRHLNDLTVRLNVFAKAHTLNVADVRGEQIEAWLRDKQAAHKWSLQTRLNYRRVINAMFEFAKRKSYLPRDWHEMERVTIPDVVRGDVRIFTPAQAVLLLRAADREDPQMVPYLALGFFCGLRHSEIERLTKENVHLLERHVYVRGKVRTAGHRLVPVCDAAESFLRDLKGAGRVCRCAEMCQPIARITRAAKAMAQAEGWKVDPSWLHNGPRHSFVSYRLAMTNNIAQVSEETGTATHTLRRHYRRPIGKSVAESWFGISQRILNEDVAKLKSEFVETQWRQILTPDFQEGSKPALSR
jgi:integrase